MSVKARGLLRLLLMCLLIVTASIAGFLWGQHTDLAYLAAAVTTLFAMLSALAVENNATNAETQLVLVLALLKKATSDDVVSDEKTHRLDLIVAMLEAQNEKFRMNLLSDKVHAMDAKRRDTVAADTAPPKNSVS